MSTERHDLAGPFGSSDYGTSYRIDENAPRAACEGRWDLFSLTGASEDSVRLAVKFCNDCPLQGDACMPEGEEAYGDVRNGWVYDQKGMRIDPERYIARHLAADRAEHLAEAREYRGDPAKCGSDGGYQRHRANGETPCPDCREAHRAYSSAMKAAARALLKTERERAA